MGDRGGVEVFTTFSSNGWPNVPTSCLVGILAPVITLIGSDSQAHMAEETKEPEEPSDSLSSRAMVATALTNYGIGFSMIVVRRGSYDVGIDRHC
jgi:choline transport protein